MSFSFVQGTLVFLEIYVQYMVHLLCYVRDSNSEKCCFPKEKLKNNKYFNADNILGKSRNVNIVAARHLKV